MTCEAQPCPNLAEVEMSWLRAKAVQAEHGSWLGKDGSRWRIVDIEQRTKRTLCADCAGIVWNALDAYSQSSAIITPVAQT